jgi:hypothetical protein
VESAGTGLALHGGEIIANLSTRARQYLFDLGLAEWLAPGHAQIDAIWFSALAVAYSPAWLEENEDGILDDWPRIPLANSIEALEASAALGRRVADILDPSSPVSAVTTGTIDPTLREIAVLERVGRGSASASELAVTARWGARDARGAVMPGPGRTDDREYNENEQLSAAAHERLGAKTRDVYLNDTVFWRNVPEEVWGFTIGGFQVLKKWLSYRVNLIVERPLTLSEVNYFRDTARRLAALRLMGPTLDENYQRCAEGSYPWRTVDIATG